MSNEYSIKFRCHNCGTIFSKNIHKGIPALGKGGECPNCGITDGRAPIGNFTVIRENEPPTEMYVGK